MRTPIQIAVAVMLSSLLLVSAAAAQTKRGRAFNVPCAKTLSIGLERVEALHAQEMNRRLKGNTDSGTEGDATVNALKNYINCRRAKTAAELKAFTAADTIAEVRRRENAAKKLARERFDGLIPGVSWDEKGADSINYAMTLRAIAEVENFKGAIVYIYSLDVEPEAGAAGIRAESNENKIREILAAMEKRTFDDAQDAANYKADFAKFKTAVNEFLKDNSDRIPTEKAAGTEFVIALLKLGATT